MRHSRELIRVVARDLGDLERAEDGCQAAWLALLEDPRIPLDHRGRAWLRTVARRAARRASASARPAP